MYVPINPLKVIRTKEYTITEDGKTIATIQQDLYDACVNVVGEKYRIITEDGRMKGQLKEAAMNFPKEVKILEDGENVTAECCNNIAVQIDAYSNILIIIYPLFETP